MRTLRHLLNLLRLRKLETDLAEEIELHQALKRRELEEAGLSTQEAAAATARAMGNVTMAREDARAVWLWPVLEETARDLCYAVRTLRASPIFTAVAVLSLALGIGANTAIFSLIDAVLLRSLPVKEPARLYSLSQTGLKGPKAISNISYGLFRQLGNDRQILSGIFGFVGYPRADVVIGGQAEVTDALLASPDYFQVLGVQPFLGRTPEPSERNVAVVSHRYWQRRFAGDPSVLGQSISINRIPHTVIGVMPPEFFGVIVGTWTDITIPAFPDIPGEPANTLKDDDTLAWVMARVADTVTEEQARASLTARAQAWLESRGRHQRASIDLTPASNGISFLRAQFSKPLRVLMTMVLLVLLIACANVAGLLLARASAREQEIAVRLGLGAGRGRLVRQLLTESLLLSAAGGALGIVFARWSRDLLANLGSTVKDPVRLDLSMDAQVLAFALLLSTLTGLFFGLVPALQTTRVDVSSRLKKAARSHSGTARIRLRRALVAGQIALALLLVTGAALFTRTLSNLKNLDPGFRRDSLLLMSIEPEASGYPRGPQIARLYEHLLDRVEAVTGVRSASLLRNPMLVNQGSVRSVVIPGREPRPEDELELVPGFRIQGARSAAVGPRFFETMGMTLSAGRDFTRADREGSPRVAVITEAFARHFFPGERALGKRFGLERDAPSAIEIVGVLKDVRQRLRDPATRTFYIPCLQDPGCWRDTTLYVRTTVDPAGLAPSLRQAITKAASNLPVFNVVTMERIFDDSVVTERTLAVLSGFFGSLALLLACIGLYGVLSYSVERRRNEIGIRMALGARPADVLVMVLKETAVLVATGLAIGLPATLAAAQWIAGFLYGLTPTDPSTIALTVGALIAVAGLSAWLPARRAARTDPFTALRHE